MKRLIAAALASTVLVGVAAPVVAQTFRDRAYQEDRAEYDRRVREYEAARERYERDRAEYDRRYGRGSYERSYGPAPTYDRYDRYDDRYDRDRYDRDRYSDRYDDRYDRYAYDPYDRFVSSECERRYTANRGGDRAGGTLLGALIGGALGVAVAGDSDETEGAVVGAIVGGALGNSIASNASTASRYAPRCDASGYYYTYDQTYPYRENTRYRSNGRYDSGYYSRQRCRLAIAPADRYGRVDYRYIRVCPDRNNRYRITA